MDTTLDIDKDTVPGGNTYLPQSGNLQAGPLYRWTEKNMFCCLVAEWQAGQTSNCHWLNCAIVFPTAEWPEENFEKNSHF